MARNRALRGVPGHVFFRSLLPTDLGENNCESKQRKRLDKQKAENHGRANRAACRRVASNAFASRRCDARLSQAAKRRCDGHGKSRSKNDGRGDVLRWLRGFRRALRERGKREQSNYDQQQKDPCKLLHCVLLFINKPTGGGSRHPLAAGLTLISKHAGLMLVGGSHAYIK